MKGTLAITGDAEADELLNSDPLALLVGMLLDQQVPMEWAFRAPSRLKERLGGDLDARRIAALSPEAVKALFVDKPALHRFPGSMGGRTHQLCQHLVDHYDGDAAALWEGVDDGAVLLERLRALPGFGDEKARIFVAVLAKRMNQRPAGWEEAAGPFADDQPRSVADVGSRDAFARVRQWKQARKAEGRTKAD
ncbi:MAG: HhH-GPD-type base excision DNA repair protein [Acidimicrobiales bacterium]